MKTNTGICDIIVPIYNAYEDLIACVNSVLEYTENTKYNLILINDKSTDERIAPYLNSLENPNIKVYENEVNQGFVKTVNRGLKLSNNDVLLLNSDTVVTPNWLSKIRQCAYSDDAIATVTPLTNNGTICSVPNFLEDNVIPDKFTLCQYAAMIESISFKRYPSLVTAVGFCMYIKRNVLEEVGLLDEESFNKGYGEENDFCCRAYEHGYRNVLCDDTFILHKGSMSFKENKNKYIEENLKVLHGKHPYYETSVRKFITENPLKDIQENIKLHIKLKNDKKNILYIIHNGLLEDINNPRGGTEFHLLDLIKEIQEFNSYVLVSTGKELLLTAFVDNDIIEFKYKIGDIIDITSFENIHYQEVLGKILDNFNINLIHVQHNKHHIANIPKIAKQRNIPVFITLHDFYYLCPTINLLDVNGSYCKRTRGAEMCSQCIKSRLGYDADFIDTWKKRMRAILSSYDRVFVPSNAAKQVISEYYPDLALNIQVIEHGTDIEKQCSFHERHENFNIAFIGGLAPYKGSGIIHDLIVKNKNKKINWYLLGNLGDQRLSLLNRKDLVKYGRYNREDIVNILQASKIDLVCILSIWPETYSYTFTEAVAAGIPVLVTDLGAPAERVKNLKVGWIIPEHASTEEMLMQINSIIDNKEDYEEKSIISRNTIFRTNKEMAAIYLEIYSNYLNSKDNVQIRSIDSEFIYRAYKIANLSSGESELGYEICMELQEKVNELQSELDSIRGTLGWKLLDRLRKNTPRIVKFFKKILYLFVRKGYKK